MAITASAGRRIVCSQRTNRTTCLRMKFSSTRWYPPVTRGFCKYHCYNYDYHKSHKSSSIPSHIAAKCSCLHQLGKVGGTTL